MLLSLQSHGSSDGHSVDQIGGRPSSSSQSRGSSDGHSVDQIGGSPSPSSQSRGSSDGHSGDQIGGSPSSSVQFNPSDQVGLSSVCRHLGAQASGSPLSRERAQVQVSNYQVGGSSGSHGMQAAPVSGACYEDYVGEAMMVDRFPYVGSWIQVSLHYTADLPSRRAPSAGFGK